MIKNDELQSLQNGHRARLRKKFLDGQLADYEILELLLTYSIPRRDVRILARQLYKKYASIPNLLAEPIESLMENEGIKENTAVLFKVIHKILELEYKSVLVKGPIFHDVASLIGYCRTLVAGKQVEEFHVLYLDSQNGLIKETLHSTGTRDWASVYVREVVKQALDLNAQGVLLLHNHPTPHVSFSKDDIEITKTLELALSQVDITLHDHLLVSGDLFYSARNLGLLDKPQQSK